MNLLNKLVVATLPLVPKPLVRYFANRYIAGETIGEAVKTVQHLNNEGVCATLDVLGEDVASRSDALESSQASVQVLHAITREHLDSNLSIKLTSLGLKLGNAFCTDQVRGILEVASDQGVFVRIDMEDSSCTSDTLSIFKTVNAEYPATGIVVQACLFRTEADVRDLVQSGTNFRLCKGIYKEAPSIAFQGRQEVQQNYLKLLRIMLENRCRVGIATHDVILVDGALKMIHEMGLRQNEYEFQMLLGVCPDLRRKLVRDGHKVRLYVPFGVNWYGYSTRRFKENPEIAGYVFKALFTPGPP